MKRVILITIAAVLCFEILFVTPFLLFTPTGNSMLAGLSQKPTPTPQPVLTVRGTPPAVKSVAAYLLDADTGNVLANINGQKSLPMASTTKVMTALLAIEKGKLDQVVTVGKDALLEIKKNEGASTAQLVPGDQIRLGDLLYGLMLPSGNDAAVAIADAIGGSVPGFVKMMNGRAKQLKLDNTVYFNTNGLTTLTSAGKPDLVHMNKTTVADLAHLTDFALDNPVFAQVVRIQRYSLPVTAKHHGYLWLTTNRLLELYPGTTGVKTGYSSEAGYCLVFSASNGKHNLVGAILHDSDKDSESRFGDAEALLDWGFNLPLLPPKKAA